MTRKLDERQIDRHVGQRIRLARMNEMITIEELARRLGKSPERIQAFERASRRPGPGALLLIARALRVPVWSLFAGADDAESDAGDVRRPGPREVTEEATP